MMDETRAGFALFFQRLSTNLGWPTPAQADQHQPRQRKRAAKTKGAVHVNQFHDVSACRHLDRLKGHVRPPDGLLFAIHPRLPRMIVRLGKHQQRGLR